MSPRRVRKHRVTAAATTAALVVALLLGSVGGVWRRQHKEQERLAEAVRNERDRVAEVARQERAAERAESLLGRVAVLRKRMRWAEAVLLLKQAEGAVQEAADGELQGKFRQAKADLGLAQELDLVREEAHTLVEGKFQPARVRDRYPQIFKRHGLNVLQEPAEALAQHIRTSAVRDEILAALDFWALVEAEGKQRRLLELLRPTFRKTQVASRWLLS